MTNLIDSSQEIWKDIPEYEGAYKASNTGKIYSYKTNRQIKYEIFEGYLRCRLRFKSKERWFYAHRLIAICFIIPVYGKPEINHKDGQKQNNNVSNLEWCTRSENMLHAFKTGLKVGSNKDRFNELHPNSKPVIKYDMSGNIVKKYPSMEEAVREGYISKCIKKVCDGVAKHHKGFKWSHN